MTEVVAIAAGFTHAFALKKDAAVWAWQSSAGKLLGGKSSPGNTPQRSDGLTGVAALSSRGTDTETPVIVFALAGWQAKSVVLVD